MGPGSKGVALHNGTRTITLVALTVSLITGCSSPADTATTAGPPGYPVTLENCGRAVTVKSPPQRAVSINQPATELLLTLGLADRMVGSASWSDEVRPELAAENAKVPVLSRDFPSFERVLKEKPDFVYATFDWSFTDEGVAPRDRFERLGVPTYQSSSECGGQDAAQQRPHPRRHVRRDRGCRQDIRRRRPRGAAGLVAADADVHRGRRSQGRRRHVDVVVCGHQGALHRGLLRCARHHHQRGRGPQRVRRQSATVARISWEAILERDPDVLVLADLTRGDDGDSVAAKIRFLESDPAAQRLTAVRERRWIVLPGTAMDPSLRNVDAVETVASGLRSFGLADK